MQAAGIHHWQQLHYLVSVVGVTLKLAEWDAVIINIFWYMSKTYSGTHPKHILVHGNTWQRSMTEHYTLVGAHAKTS